MIRLLGRQTSGNVQKVIFMLEEASIPYTREDYGRQFGNTQTAEYLALNPNAKVPTLVEGDVVIWESHTILRFLATSHAPGLTGATAAERSAVERWMDWLLASVNGLYLTMFKEAKKPPAERVSDFDAQAKELIAMLAIADAHLARPRIFRPRQAHHRRHGARPDPQALRGFSDRRSELLQSRSLDRPS